MEHRTADTGLVYVFVLGGLPGFSACPGFRRARQRSGEPENIEGSFLACPAFWPARAFVWCCETWANQSGHQNQLGIIFGLPGFWPARAFVGRGKARASQKTPKDHFLVCRAFVWCGETWAKQSSHQNQLGIIFGLPGLSSGAAKLGRTKNGYKNE